MQFVRIMQARGVTVGVLVWVWCFAGPARAAENLPAGFQDSIVLGGSGLVDAVALRFAPDGRVFVAERRGTIKVFEDINDASATLVADLSLNVYNAWDRGMLGLAVHPQFPSVPYIYVLYTFDARVGQEPPLWGDICPDPPGFTDLGCDVASRLSRLQIAGDVMVGTEEVLIEAWCQQFPSHSVGDVHFGPDGALYLSHGDGASFNFEDFGQVENLCADPPFEGGSLRSQDLETPGDPVSLDGTLLRVDDIGQALPDNPLFGGADASDDRIIAYGLRNPFRFTVRPQTTELWIGDVGWGAWEEIDRVLDPVDAVIDNFGWPCYEGAPMQPGFDSIDLPICEGLYATGTAIAPYYAYAHQNTSSITGLAFHEGGSYPPDYEGALFFADFSAGWIKVMFAGDGGDPDPASILTFATAVFAVDLQMGPGGDLFYIDYDRFGPEFVHRVTYFSENEPPLVVLQADVTSGPAPLTVNFDASASFDPDSAEPVAFAWDLDGDGAFDDASGPTAQKTFDVGGSVVVSVQVSDTEGASSTDAVLISIDNAPPVPTIVSPTADSTWRVGDTITLQGFAEDPDEGVLPAESLWWEVSLHHCEELEGGGQQCHQHFLLDFFGVAEASFSAVDHEYPSFLEIALSAADGGPADWFDPAWLRRRRLSFNNSAQGEHLFDFPVMVQLDPARIDYALTADGGADLRFVDRDGTLLAHDIEAWNPDATSIVWVRVPRVDAGSNDDFVWMYYGNDDAVDGQAPAEVWSADYRGVWHLSDDGGGFDPPTPGGPQLQNPGFESGLSGWEHFGSVFAAAFDPHAGALHLKMFGLFNGQPNASISHQDLPAAAGQRWRLDCFSEHIAGDNITASANFAEMKLEFYDASDNLLGASGAIILNGDSPEDQWIDNTPVDWLAPPGTALARALLTFVQIENESGAAFYDDVTLEVVGENASFDVHDASAHGNGGLNSGSTPAGGRLAGGRSFNGAAAVSVGSLPALDQAGALTVQAWIQVADPDAGAFMRLLSKKSAWDGPAGFELEYNPGLNYLTVLGSGADFGRAENVDLDSGWHHVAATIQGTQAQLYVDGMDLTTDGTVSPLRGTAQALIMGRHGGGGSFFEGALDEVRVSGVARSSDWIAAQYASMNGTFVSVGAAESRTVLTASTSVQIQPETATIALHSVPSGLELTIYGESQVTPFERQAIVFANIVVSATTPQGLDGITYSFESWSDGGPQTHNTIVPVGGALLTATFSYESCPIEPCADLNDDGVRDDNCLWWSCAESQCQATGIVFADMGGPNGSCPPDGATDGNDRFHALNCFADQDTTATMSYPCEDAPPNALNVDAGGPFGSCVPDGVCDGHDAFHALNVFENQSTCTCPLDGPQPRRSPQPPQLALAGLEMVPSRTRVLAGETLEVDVLLATPLQALRGYQLHARASGGRRGTMDLVDLAIRPRRDAVFSGLVSWQAFNLGSAQLLAGLDGPGVPAGAGTYLATLTWRASDDAAGAFSIELLYGKNEPAGRTYLFPTAANDRIDLLAVEPAVIEVRRRRGATADSPRRASTP